MPKIERRERGKKTKIKIKRKKAELKQRIIDFTNARSIEGYLDIVDTFLEFQREYTDEPWIQKMKLLNFCDPLKPFFVIKHKDKRLFKRKKLTDRIVEFTMGTKQDGVFGYSDITSAYERFRDAHFNESVVRQLNLCTFCIALEPFFVFDHRLKRM
jgi:hypothetical protein